MTNANTICEAVRAYFRSQKISFEEAAARLNLTRTAISKQLADRPFSQKSAARWAETFGFSAAYLLTGEGALVPGDPAQPSTQKAVTLPGEVVSMFTDMAATIRSQQETVAQLSAMVGRLAVPAAPEWSKKEPASSTEEAGAPIKTP